MQKHFMLENKMQGLKRKGNNNLSQLLLTSKKIATTKSISQLLELHEKIGISSNKVFLYCYYETIARKGADEVTLMLYDFSMKHLDKEIRSVELFCDSCAGQNKNCTLISFMDFFIHEKKGLATFPERGHSYMKCDKDMGLINKRPHVFHQIGLKNSEMLIKDPLRFKL